jgi:hypothetical protein
LAVGAFLPGETSANRRASKTVVSELETNGIELREVKLDSQAQALHSEWQTEC